MRRLCCAAAILWTAGKELLGTPPEQAVFNQALERLKEDPRITLSLGTPITGAWGSGSQVKMHDEGQDHARPGPAQHRRALH